MIPRIRKSLQLDAGDHRIVARMTLGFVAAVLCLLLALAGTSIGRTGAFMAQPSPSGSSGGGGGASIFLLNPSTAYAPASDVTEPPSDPTEPDDPPKVSDKFDGVDTTYHVVAVVDDAPPGAIVEAYYQESGFAEVTAGELTPVPGSPDTYELDWNIQGTIDAFFGTFTVRLFAQTPAGFEEIATDAVEVRMQHEDTNWITAPPEGQIPEAETVELSWPSQGGPLGFYKGANSGAVWNTVVQGTASIPQPGPDANNPERPSSVGTSQVRVFYSRTPAGQAPEFVQCGSGSAGAGGPNGSRQFTITCTLQGTHRPSQVTALAAVAMENQSGSGDAPLYSQEAADVHRVHPYLQRVEDMELTLSTNVTGDQPFRRHLPEPDLCVTYKLKVIDALDRPVQGANVDIHVRGPGDAVEFGTDMTTAGSRSSGKQKPQKSHSTESSRDCDDTTSFDGEHGDHNVPGGDDIKHVESTSGTGLSGGGGVGAGEWLFHLYSPVVGDAALTAWIDDEGVADDSVKREADDDILEAGEASDTSFAQWLPAAPAVTIDPPGATAGTGTCQRFVVRVRGGSRAVRGANVDVHATGPTDELDFCDPGDGSPRRAPDKGTGHNAEDAGEVSHAGQPPVAQHTEGETNDQGNFIVGIVSPVPGDTTLTAWYDSGESGFDDDTLGSEASGTATTNWVTSTGDAAISFLNPSPYGPGPESVGDGTNVGRRQDVDAAFHIVTRVSSLQPVPGVELFYRSGTNPLVKIADATRIGSSDAYEAYWPVDVTDDDYTLVARIAGTTTTVEQDIVVNNSTTATDPTDVPYESAEITAPLDGQQATFVNRRLTVKGVASGGAEGVDLFYTRAGSLATPGTSAWVFCGYAGMTVGTVPKEFTGQCELQGADQPGQVTGIAALTFDCTQSGCNGAPGAGPQGIRNIGENDSGDAHRVFGTEANPILAMEPAETAANTGACQKFVVSLQDQTGQPVAGQNLDVHLTGPGNSGNFCAPTDGTGTSRGAPDAGGHISDGNETDEAYHDEGGTRTQHTEGNTTGNGRLVFGIESQTAGDAQLTVWLDSNGDDLFGQGETSDISIMHWETDAVCDITGTNGPDTLTGTDAPERICGFGGNDTITGGGGGDLITGGAGRDSLRGNAGNDRVAGGPGKDAVLGGGGGDRLSGGRGADRVRGHKSNDRLRGNAGNDRIDGGTGRDDCAGGGGRDRLRRCETGTRSFAARIEPI